MDTDRDGEMDSNYAFFFEEDGYKYNGYMVEKDIGTKYGIVNVSCNNNENYISRGDFFTGITNYLGMSHYNVCMRTFKLYNNEKNLCYKFRYEVMKAIIDSIMFLLYEYESIETWNTNLYARRVYRLNKAELVDISCLLKRKMEMIVQLNFWPYDVIWSRSIKILEDMDEIY